MKGSFELRVAGSGGQGVVLMSIILAEAGLRESKNVVQSQSYGPEARGGMCKADVVISGGGIDYPKVEYADCLLALTQESLDKYAGIVKKGGVIVTDSGMDATAHGEGRKIVSAAILQTAMEKTGNEMTANIVALGVLNATVNVVKQDSLKAAVLKYVPKGTEELNLLALNEGRILIETLKDT